MTRRRFTLPWRRLATFDRMRGIGVQFEYVEQPKHARQPLLSDVMGMLPRSEQ